MPYTSDLTNKQFKLIDSLVPKSKTRDTVIPRRQIFNAIFYQLKNGCQWRDLPSDLPKWQTVYSQFRRWKQRGVWDRVLIELEKVERQRHGKKRNTNSSTR
jgi:transposase